MGTSYKFLIDDTNRIHALLSKAEAESNQVRAQDHHIEAAIIAYNALDRLLENPNFISDLEDLEHGAAAHSKGTLFRRLFQRSTPSRSAVSTEVLRNLDQVLAAEERVLIVAGMEEEPANLLITEARRVIRNHEAVIRDMRIYDPAHRLIPALGELRVHSRELAERLKRERTEAEVRKMRRETWERVFFGVGGAAIIGANLALGAGLLIATAGAGVPLTAASYGLGSGIIVSKSFP